MEAGKAEETPQPWACNSYPGEHLVVDCWEDYQYFFFQGWETESVEGERWRSRFKFKFKSQSHRPLEAPLSGGLQGPLF